MKSGIDCIPCAIDFGIRTMRKAGVEDPEILWEIMERIKRFDLSRPPSDIANEVFRVIKEKTEVEDPYKEDKIKQNRWALSIYPELKTIVNKSSKPLLYAIKISALGNTIDLGVSGSYHLSLEEIESLSLGVNHIEIFKEKIKMAETVLFIADNAGEIIFDRILIEEIMKMGKKVMVGVKSGPIINDITIKEAEKTGIDAEFIETGTSTLGIEMDKVSQEFKEKFYNSDIVIAKGHANFETLDRVERDIFFLLKAKCELVANALGVKKGEFVFRYKSS